MRHFIIFLTVFASSWLMNANAQTVTSDYEKLSNKATRFFDNQEWASANAMYILMLEKQPDSVSVYAHAVVANIMAGDTLQALDMTQRSLGRQIPIENLLTDVRDISFNIGNGKLYEEYLLKIKQHFPWFSRIADNYLMEYYAFRQNSPKLIEYACTMLEGLPDDLRFLRMLAYGMLLDGKTEQAIQIWLKTALKYPQNYDTTLDLANCYKAMGNASEALKWYKKAYSLHPTPYVASMIDCSGGMD